MHSFLKKLLLLVTFFVLALPPVETFAHALILIAGIVLCYAAPAQSWNRVGQFALLAYVGLGLTLWLAPQPVEMRYTLTDTSLDHLPGSVQQHVEAYYAEHPELEKIVGLNQPQSGVKSLQYGELWRGDLSRRPLPDSFSYSSINDWLIGGLNSGYNYYKERILDPEVEDHYEVPFVAEFSFRDQAALEVCTTGNAIWTDATGTQTSATSGRACRTLGPAAEESAPRLYLIHSQPGSVPQIDVTPSGYLAQGFSLLFLALPYLLTAMLAAGGFRLREANRQKLLVCGLIALAAVIELWRVVGDRFEQDWLHGFLIYEGGNDGLLYINKARQMVFELLSGDLAGFLRGGADIFYFMPGMRYLQSAMIPLFGESTHIGVVLLTGFSGLILFEHAKKFAPRNIAFLLFLLFITPLLKDFGLSIIEFYKQSMRGFAEPSALIFLMLAVGLLYRTSQGETPDGRGNLLAALGIGTFCSLAIFLRPNYLPGAGIVILGGFFFLVRRRAWGSAVALCLASTLSFLALAHNLYFSGEFVLFTKSVAIDDNLGISPKTYLLFAFDSLRNFAFPGESPLYAFWSESILKGRHVFLLAPLALGFYALFGARQGFTRFMTFATLAQFSLVLFYKSGGRYNMVIWMLAFYLFLALLQERGWALSWSAKIRRVPLLRAAG